MLATLDSSLIESLCNAELAAKDERFTRSDVSYTEYQLKYRTEVCKHKYKKFLNTLLDDAEALGITVTVTDLGDEAINLHMSHEPYATPDEERPSKFKIQVRYRGDLRVLVFALNKGKYPNVKWVKQTQAILKGKGWTKSGCRNDLEGTDFNFRLTWFKNWLKQAKILQDKLLLEKREYLKSKKREQIKCEYSLGQIQPIAQMIEDRLGVKVNVEYNDQGTAFWLKCYNVKHVDNWGCVNYGLFLPIEAYERYKNSENNIGFRHLTYDKLVQHETKPVKLYSLVGRCGSQGERCTYMNPLTFSISRGGDPTNTKCYLTVEGCSLPLNNKLKTSFSEIELDEIETYINAYLDYEEKAYEAYMAYDKAIRSFNETIPENYRH